MNWQGGGGGGQELVGERHELYCTLCMVEGAALGYPHSAPNAPICHSYFFVLLHILFFPWAHELMQDKSPQGIIVHERIQGIRIRDNAGVQRKEESNVSATAEVTKPTNRLVTPPPRNPVPPGGRVGILFPHQTL